MGSALYLPFSDDLIPTIELSLAIYKKWIGLYSPLAIKVTIPDCLKDDKQRFYQEIIKHLSIIFEKRTNPKSSTEKYLNICKEVLKIYCSIATELGTQISESTWDVLLRVNLGIANKFLSEPKSQTDPFDLMSQLFIDTLFDIWLKSGTQNDKHFAHLSNFIAGWVHRENVIQAWARVCKGLTKRLLRVLYNVAYSANGRYIKPPQTGQINLIPFDAYDNFLKDQTRYVVILPHESKETQTAKIYNLSNEQLVYFWIRFVLLFERRITNYNENLGFDKKGMPFFENEVHQLYVKCLADILKEFANVGRIVKRTPRDVLYETSEVEKAFKYLIPARFVQNSDYLTEISKLFLEISTEHSMDPIPSNVPNGNVIMKLFGINFFEAAHQMSGNYEQEKSSHAELCKLFSNFPGPFLYSYPAWFYYRLSNYLTKYKDKIQFGASHLIILNSYRLFLSDLHGIRMLAPLYANHVKEILGNPGSANANKLIRICLKILSQLICVPCNFMASETSILKEEKGTSAISLLNRYIEMQKSLNTFLDTEVQESNLSGDLLCQLLWVGALNTLQNRQPREFLDFGMFALNRAFNDRFDNDVFDPKKIVTIIATLDILEMLVHAVCPYIEQAITHQLNIIACHLVVFADDKIPVENSVLAKRILQIKNYGIEKILCKMLQLSILILNVTPQFENEALISCLKSIIMKCKKGLTNEKLSKSFSFGYVENVTEFVINCISLYGHKHRITPYSPNINSVFCNKYPKEKMPVLYSSTPNKTHLILNNELRIITISEISIKSGLYDLMVIARDENGCFVYRSQLISNLRQLADLLSEKPEEDVNSISPKAKTDSIDEKFVPQSNLISEKPIPLDTLPPEDNESFKNLENLIREESAKENSIINSKIVIKSEKIDQEYESSRQNNSKNTVPRLFYKHFQFIENKRIQNAALLSETQEFYNELKQLDNKPLRYTQYIPILYYKSSTQLLYESNYKEDVLFNEIISEMGVELEEKHIKTGNFNNYIEIIQEMGTIYSTEFFLDQLFVVPTLKLNNRTVFFIFSILKSTSKIY